MTEADIELLEIFKISVLQGYTIIHHNNTVFFEILEEKFPIGFNRIDWNKHKEYFSESLGNTKNQTEKEEHIKFFLNKISISFPELKQEKVIVFGDNSIDLAYEMNFEVFVKHAHLFFELPQHTYVLFTESMKCLNYTFEDVIYFG